MVRSVKMKEEKMVALWRRNQGFFLPLHSITLEPPNTHAGFNVGDWFAFERCSLGELSTLWEEGS